MAYLLNRFGLINNLLPWTQANGFQRLEFKMQAIDPALMDPAFLEDRADLVIEDGFQAYRYRRYVDDSDISARPRVEAMFSDTTTFTTPLPGCQIADWVGLGIPGADINASIRRYRFMWKMPGKRTDLSYLNSTTAISHPYFICWQLAPRLDDLDTEGQPVLARRIHRDAFGHYWTGISQNYDPDPISIDPETEALDFLTYEPFFFDRWYDDFVDVQWSWTNLGYLDIYQDQILRVRRPGLPNCMNNQPPAGGGGMYPKEGMYFAPWTSCNIFAEKFSRGMIVGDYQATLPEMYPEIKTGFQLYPHRIASAVTI